MTVSREGILETLFQQDREEAVLEHHKTDKTALQDTEEREFK